MIVTVIGSSGQVGRTLVNHFRECGQEVLCIDRDNELNLETAARAADVVFIVTLPIEEVSSLFRKACHVMRPGTLLAHGTSIENPVSPGEIKVAEAVENGITVSHCHFHFFPQSPLSRTLYGQTVTLSTFGPKKDEWNAWLESCLVPYQPILYYLRPDEHDHITTISQLIHMYVSLLVGIVWSDVPRQTLEKGLLIGGPPCRFLVRSVVRTAKNGRVVRSILENHPFAIQTIESLERALAKIRLLVEKKDPGLETVLGKTRSSILPHNLEKLDGSTEQLIRLEADVQQATAEFRFSAEKNQTGLLARILTEFDKRNVDKTSTIAQVTPDGGCIILIGVRNKNSAAVEAEAVVRSWM